jgi:hypothetical protein
MGIIPLDQAVRDVAAAAADLQSERQCDRLALATCLQKISDVLARGLTPDTRRGLRSAYRMAAASLGVDHD